MNITRMHSLFNSVLDHTNEPYFLDNEVDDFIDMGVNHFLADIVFKDLSPSVSVQAKRPHGTSSLESDKLVSSILAPLTFNITVPHTSGVVRFSDIDAALMFEAEEIAELMIILSVSSEGTDYEARYTRYMDRKRRSRNVFTKPTAESPFFHYQSDGIVIEPAASLNYDLSVIKRPRKVSLELGKDCDLPDSMHLRILSYALAAAGVASRDDVMLNLQQAAGMGANRE